MIILNFITATLYLWMFIAVTFGSLVLSPLLQSILVFTLFLAFLTLGLNSIADKLRKNNTK